jgi:UDP:flavonoid glycosyltransferase YjiC (YdhE family)
MRILFVSFSGPSHLIPLLRLNELIRRPGVTTAFLLDQKGKDTYGQMLVNMGITVLQCTYGYTISSELAAYHVFRPDVVVDDCSFTTGYCCQLRSIPRVSIVRTGTFPFTEPMHKDHQHSLPVDINKLPDVSCYGLTACKSLPDFFKADAHVVPGIRSIEVMPKQLRDTSSYYYSGPLIMDGIIHVSGELVDFLRQHINDRKVYLTFGLVAEPTHEMIECIRFLLDSEIAVVTNIPVGNLTEGQQQFYFTQPYLPMRYVSSKVDLVIHQCGSATYHYPILEKVPGITIGTEKYDRNDVAVRLEELGISEHIPSPNETKTFIELFKTKVQSILNESGQRRAARFDRLEKLKEEVISTSNAFDFMSVVDRALCRDRAAATPAPG